MGLFSAKCVSTARLDGKTAVITGCNTGIGKVTARDFFQRGAKVIMACRNLEKTNQAVKDIKTECVGQENLGELEVVELDLSSLQSVRKCALNILEKEDKINILVNNAGVMMCPLTRTADGFEMQIGTNHFGHFLFTLLLLPKIVTSTPARIVNVASLAHVGGKIDFDDINWEKRSYSSINAYRQSKLANILFTKELTRRLAEAEIKDVRTYALHPGAIATDIGRHLDDSVFKAEQGAQTTIHCAVAEEAGTETGLYYAECKPTTPSAAARDEEVAKKLWNESLKIVGLGENYTI